MAGHGPAPTDRRRRAPDAPRHHATCSRPRTRSGPARSWGAASGCRCGSSRSPRPTRTASRSAWPAQIDRPVEGRRPRPLLPRLGRRDLRDARRRRPGRVPAEATLGPAGRRRRRRRGSCPSTTSTRWSGRWPTWRRRRRARRAGPDERRHRPARARLPRRVRELTRRTGTILIIDETHTICAGPGGMTASATASSRTCSSCGKTIGGGDPGRHLRDVGRGRRPDPRRRCPSRTLTSAGVGGTLAGYALSLAAIRATLGEVLTAEAFERDDPARRSAGRRASTSVIASRRRSVARDPAGLPGPNTTSVATPPRDGAEQCGRRRRAARALPPPRRRSNRRVLHDAVPQHGPHVPGTTEADVDRRTRRRSPRRRQPVRLQTMRDT